MTDRLSPILVKELRQGIRSQLFTGSFLLVQALLFLFGLSFVLSDSLQKDSTAGSVLFWTMLALPLVVLVPASASQAVEREVSGRTLELLLLTRLSSYRIILGKWASVVLQTSLLLVSALPYVILRYFLGGVDVFGELQTMGGLLLGSGLLAGIAMGFWSLNVPRLAKWAAVLLLSGWRRSCC
jgi:ABC-type transport system involved in multi-copper enzyme maturation permease subunit